MAETKTILIVDDDIELSDGLRIMLERKGYRVLQARDGQQGKSLIYQHRPDLVILDMMMPRMGGYPVLEHFRGKPDAPPIILVSESPAAPAASVRIGAAAFVPKPCDPEEVATAVARTRRLVGLVTLLALLAIFVGVSGVELPLPRPGDQRGPLPGVRAIAANLLVRVGLSAPAGGELAFLTVEPGGNLVVTDSRRRTVM